MNFENYKIQYFGLALDYRLINLDSFKLIVTLGSGYYEVLGPNLEDFSDLYEMPFIAKIELRKHILNDRTISMSLEALASENYSSNSIEILYHTPYIFFYTNRIGIGAHYWEAISPQYSTFSLFTLGTFKIKQ